MLTSLGRRLIDMNKDKTSKYIIKILEIKKKYIQPNGIVCSVASCLEA